MWSQIIKNISTIFFSIITFLLARAPMVLPGVYSIKENPIFKPRYKPFPNKICSESVLGEFINKD